MGAEASWFVMTGLVRVSTRCERVLARFTSGIMV